MYENKEKKSNNGLPENLKTGIENLSGYDMSDVKVHYNSSKPAQLQAHAYAQGNNIYLGPNQQKHLPHEAWHVVQQKQGRVRATTQMKGIGINDSSALEREADVMGKKAESTTIIQQHTLNNKIFANSMTIQRKGEIEALENITSTERRGTEMRRGNNRNSIVGTNGKSYAWVRKIRSVEFNQELRDKVNSLYLKTNNNPQDFDNWFNQRKNIIEGLVYKNIGAGNCGEFAIALYGLLQQKTQNQYIYHASWMREPNQITLAMNNFKTNNNPVTIKANNSDHAFVVTYPNLVEPENFRFIEERNFVDSDHPSPNNIETVTRYRLAPMQGDQVMISDAWLDREVKVLSNTNYDDNNIILTEPTRAGENKLDINIHREIVIWAKEQNEDQSISLTGLNIAQNNNNNFFYTDNSHKGRLAYDRRPDYIKAFHGREEEQVDAFRNAHQNDSVNLINYIKQIGNNLIEGLGNKVREDRNSLGDFIQCLKKANNNEMLQVFAPRNIVLSTPQPIRKN